MWIPWNLPYDTSNQQKQDTLCWSLFKIVNMDKAYIMQITNFLLKQIRTTLLFQLNSFSWNRKGWNLKRTTPLFPYNNYNTTKQNNPKQSKAKQTKTTQKIAAALQYIHTTGTHVYW